MFVIVENEQIVHLGPMHWNQRMFQSVIRDELELDFVVPLSNNMMEPIIINENYKILPVTIVYPSTHNSKIEQYAGPFWTFVNNTAIGTYQNVSKPEDAIKLELKAIVAHNRWIKEVGGITVNIQNQELFISTARNDRDVYSQALLQNLVKTWKFGNVWLTLTIPDLQIIVNAIQNHVQSVFDWEQSKVVEIDSTLGVLLLDSISLTPPEGI